MEIKGLGPHTVIVGQGNSSEENKVGNPSGFVAAVPQIENSNSESSVSDDSEKSKASRLSEVIQLGEKRKLLRSKKDRKRQKVIAAYALVRALATPQKTKGTLVEKVT